MEQDIIHFILIELIYLLFFILFNVTESNFIYYFACLFASFKYAVSSLDSIDIITYNKVYDSIHQANVDKHGMEAGYLALIYISNQLGLPVILIHAISIFIFLLSVRFFLNSFLPSSLSNKISLCFGFFAAGGELCSYLLRQLLSISLVIFGVGFLFRDYRKIAFSIYLSSFLFHSTPVFLIPIFASVFLKDRKKKILFGILFFVGISIIVSSIDIGSSLISSVLGEGSNYTLKYDSYTSREGIREGNRTGLFGIIMLVYFMLNILINFKKNLFFSQALFHISTIIINLFSFYIEIVLNAFWFSTRISFISRILILISNIIMTLEIIKNKKIVMTCIGCFIFIGSCLSIVKNYNDNGIYRLPF